MLGIRKYFKGDPVIWLIATLLTLMGLLAVYSATGTLAYANNRSPQTYLFKQLFLAALGFGIMWLAHLVNFQYYSRVSQILILISIPLLLYTLYQTKEVNAAKRWITLPLIGLSFQTSDFAKLGLIMYVARFLSKHQEEDSKSKYLYILASISVVCLLIFPADLSTSALLFLTSIVLLFVGRIPFKYLGGIAVGGALLFFIGYTILINSDNTGRTGVWKSRVETFLGQEDADPAKTFQNDQAKIAIVRGGLFGVGPGKSVQRNFLPSPYTDFIYSIIIEEYGLVFGALPILFLYLLLLWRSIKIVINTPKSFGAFLAIGLCLLVVLQALVHMGVNVNVFPVTGLTLPMVSLGGTSLLFTSMAFGIILSVSRYGKE